MSQNISIFWFRRDLRLHDNAGLYEALKTSENVLPLFIFDRDILDKLENKKDRRVEFIHQALQQIQQTLGGMGKKMIVRYGTPLEIYKQLTKEYDIKAVFTNHDYEPYARKRDEEIKTFLEVQNIEFHTFKDQCIFEKSEILSNTHTIYTVFTPYSKKWKEKANNDFLKSYPTEKYFNNFTSQKDLSNEPDEIISLEKMGFEATNQPFPSKEVRDEMIANYKQTREFPAKNGTSRIGVHLRFGTLSIRELAERAKILGETYLNELIWRDFYAMILWNFPHVATNAFRREYETIEWRNNETEFANWCEGKTGYPIVDAGMRELNATGFMHNRVRMITASFLTKHLLIDWRWGEAYFAEKLLDFDMSSNNGGWQWAASTGCDAAPYFRIFNPSEQTKKFDTQLEYIKKWVPEFSEFYYPKPIVEHKLARERALETYKKGLEKAKNAKISKLI
jgi:deoxyribodipyrimidine photo-lyase